MLKRRGREETGPVFHREDGSLLFPEDFPTGSATTGKVGAANEARIRLTMPRAE